MYLKREPIIFIKQAKNKTSVFFGLSRGQPARSESSRVLILKLDGNWGSDIQLGASTLSASVELVDLQGDAVAQNDAHVDSTTNDCLC